MKKSLQDFDNVIVSTGALKKKELDKLIKLKKHKNLILLHCVSSYPLEYKTLILKSLIISKINLKMLVIQVMLLAFMMLFLHYQMVLKLLKSILQQIDL